ncbi:hypothetical protein EN943_02595 [Mesorhizobium sp. M7A.F.Ca.US.006.01.1.1]|uniref:hypothetical protein n=1 Tax=Mesorhizobium sp. M7A.F.Ca.US.006.01.1.1 TaxID=2496707 RepID=UPI000FCB8323|nr:hypothetical protein [Mesorhizobium sp. M7A.F.Ca.US.006.01.1.1]RUZ80818.1 hypothetical protein EN943_02595 [Mesorhizobium sp. M7A.F.Ca.US.006.01.1.1]
MLMVVRPDLCIVGRADLTVSTGCLWWKKWIAANSDGLFASRDGAALAKCYVMLKSGDSTISNTARHRFHPNVTVFATSERTETVVYQWLE